MSRILATLDALVAGRKASRAHVDELRALVRRSLIAKAGRAQSARQRARQRSEAIRSRIRDAVRQSPLCESLHVLVAVVKRRMGSDAASLPTIRSELRRMRDEIGKDGTEDAGARPQSPTSLVP